MPPRKEDFHRIVEWFRFVYRQKTQPIVSLHPQRGGVTRPTKAALRHYFKAPQLEMCSPPAAEMGNCRTASDAAVLTGT